MLCINLKRELNSWLIAEVRLFASFAWFSSIFTHFVVFDVFDILHTFNHFDDHDDEIDVDIDFYNAFDI